MLLVTPSISPSLSLSLPYSHSSLVFFELGCSCWKGSRSNQRVGCLDWGHLCSLCVGSGLTQCFFRQSVIQRCPVRDQLRPLLTTTHTIQSSMSGHGLLDGVNRLKTSYLSWKLYHLLASSPWLLALFWFERGQNTRRFRPALPVSSGFRPQRRASTVLKKTARGHEQRQRPPVILAGNVLRCFNTWFGCLVWLLGLFCITILLLLVPMYSR